MQCRNCGIEIADKALICFRCGTATTEAKFKAPPPRRAGVPWPMVLTIVVLVAAVVLIAVYVARC